MDYYIQGDAANANQIKAAFKELGYNTRGLNFSDGFFYTVERDVHYCDSYYCVVSIIKTHPDYKELELPVEPKFKKGDWIACDADSFTLSIKSVKDGNYYFHQGASLPIKDIDEHYHLWTIADAKDGDVLVTTKIRSCPFIYRKTNYNNNLAYYYAGIDGNGDFCEGCLKRTLYHFGEVANVTPATKEQRDLLFKKMREAGYEWDADKKELHKTQPHYNIANFKPFDKVLVRDDYRRKWQCSWFSDYDKELPYPFITTGSDYGQCIPFEGNEHLLGTTDMPDEMYINW